MQRPGTKRLIVESGSPTGTARLVARGLCWHLRGEPPMSKETKNRFAPLVALFLIAGAPLVGCESEGPGEKAGKSVDKAAEKVKDTVSPPGPMEKAGQEADKAIGK
jgi:hypothetical protein